MISGFKDWKSLRSFNGRSTNYHNKLILGVETGDNLSEF